MDSKNTESLIRNLGKGDTADYEGCRECSICLGSVLVSGVLDKKEYRDADPKQRPYQCLFMAACAHVWHYKCVSRLIHTPDYPMFQCPNCRAYTDLSAEVDDSNDFEEEVHQDSGPEPELEPVEEHGTFQEESAVSSQPGDGGDDNHLTNGTHSIAVQDFSREADLAFNVQGLSLHDGNGSAGETEGGNRSISSLSMDHGQASGDDMVRSANIDIPRPRRLGSSMTHVPTTQQHRMEMGEDNPLTPRNDSGPLAFDGRAGVTQGLHLHP